MISALALTAMALAPTTEAAFRKFDFGKKKPKSDGFKFGKPIHKESKATCGSIAISENFSAAKSAHVAAVAKAWKYACSTDAKFDKYYWAHIYKVAFDTDHKSGFAFAFAKAVTATAAKCVTSGNAYGCASAYSYASAWASAVATAHAAAWSEAIQYCECANKEQITAANADAYAGDIAYLETGLIEAVSESHACGFFGHDYEDSNAQTCLANIYATVTAKAVAIAAIDGKCIHKDIYDYSGSGDKDYGAFVAAALAEAETTIKGGSIYGCVDYVSGYNPYW